ncbi:hypothetical protein D3C85_1378150 [compost metagenome]
MVHRVESQLLQPAKEALSGQMITEQAQLQRHAFPFITQGETRRQDDFVQQCAKSILCLANGICRLAEVAGIALVLLQKLIDTAIEFHAAARRIAILQQEQQINAVFQHFAQAGPRAADCDG